MGDDLTKRGGVSGEHSVGDAAELAASLEPALRDACGGQLSKIEWFRSSWQAGGAGTGYATFTDAQGEHPAVVKLPVGPVEHDWTAGMGAIGPERSREVASKGPTPVVFASGRSLAGYDLAWIVMERFEGHPLSQDLKKETLCEFLDTVAEWYACARARRVVSGRPPERDWDQLLSRSRDMAKEAGLADAQHWNKLIHQVQKALPRLSGVWSGRRTETWCHGDLHPGNGMWRANGSLPGHGKGRCVLIDLSLVHAGHWVEDAVYLERLFWGHKERLDGVKPVARLAKALKDKGFHPDEEDYALLANVRRLLMAACVPVYVAREGSPRYVGAAMETMERLLPLLTRG